MCGIAGFIGFNDDALLSRMCGVLTHRGPDEDGFYTADGVGLAMRRLSVIDLTSGTQPICNEDRTVWVVFNGEIYNYQELTEGLKARGHRFSTRSDTETIVHLYEEYGTEFVQHLRGMFAIAIWDAKARQLVLARDRIGEKPLFYSAHGAHLLFGSEIKAILQSRRGRAVRPQTIPEFLTCGYVPAPHTFFDGIQKLRPGEMLVHQHGRVRLIQYWTLGAASARAPSFDEASRGLVEHLRDSIRLCLKSDVEVGAFLSGGIDSSLIVALMAEHGAQIQTFSVGYRGRAAGFNELDYARQVSRHAGTLHHELVIDGNANLDLLPRVLWHFDEPLAEPTSVLVYLLCQFARERVKVALGGTGGDEAFFGYPRHAGIRHLERYRRIPRLLRRGIVEPLIRKWPESTRGSRFAKRARRLVSSAELPAHEAYMTWVSLLNHETRARLIAPHLASERDSASGEEWPRSILEQPDRELLSRAAELDVCGYLPEFQLTYMDRMSMAHGLEVRSPLCDYRLIEYVLGLPAAYRLKGTRSKHILKSVAARWLPRNIVERKKVGFDSPIGQWFKDELREFLLNFLAPEQVRRSGLLNPAGVQAVLAEHLAGRRDYSLQLWAILMVEAWHRMYIEDGVTDGSNYELADLRGALPRKPAIPRSRPAAEPILA